MVKFDATREEHRIIAEIVDRAIGASIGSRIFPVNRQDAIMDITAVHCNGCPLKLAELAAADAFNFNHDVFGIFRHIDRTTGKLKDCFVPRFAQPERPAGMPEPPVDARD